MAGPSRRQFLTGVASATVVGMAGCTVEYNGPGPGAGGGGTVPTGDIPHRQEITRNDADEVAGTPEQLREQTSRSDVAIAWIPNDATLDFTGTDLHLEGTVVASGRGEGQTGGRIITNDRGKDSPAWHGGSNEYGLISLGDNARLTGVVLRGPEYDRHDHPELYSYIPFAPQDSRSARDRWRDERNSRGVTVVGDDVTIDNCEIHAFSVQAISVGQKHVTPENTVISHCYIHAILMTSLGYAVDVRHGHPQIHECYFDACRHCVNGSGMSDAGYYVTNTTFGPWATGHQIDMHGVHDNVSGSSNPDDRNYRWRAGGTMVVENCDVMAHEVPDLPFINRNRGDSIYAVRVRAVPEDGFYFENNRVAHSSPDAALDQTNINGVYSPNDDGYRNFYYSDNEWGVDFG